MTNTECGHFSTFGPEGRSCENCFAYLNRFRVYTGPTLVPDVAQRLRKAGFNVYVEGTEHVFVSKFNATQQDALNALGSTWRARDVEVLQ